MSERPSRFAISTQIIRPAQIPTAYSRNKLASFSLSYAATSKIAQQQCLAVLFPDAGTAIGCPFLHYLQQNRV